MEWFLTIIGIDKKNKGHLRPRVLVVNPKNISPMKPPIGRSAANHEASSIVILPDGNNVSSDVSRGMLGVIQPIFTPKRVVKMETVCHCRNYEV